MARPEYYGEKTAKRVGIVLLLLAVFLVARSTTPLPDMTDALARQSASLEPLAESTQTDLPEEPMQQEETEEPIETAIATPAPTQKPGTWSYETSRIKADVERIQQGDFVYFAVDVTITDASQFAYAFANEKYEGRAEALSDIAERNNPLVAINGDYYGFHDKGVIIRGGELYRTVKSTRHLLIVEENGDLSVLMDRSEEPKTLADTLMARNVRHTYEFGPVLVEHGQAVELSSTILRVEDDYVEPRTAIGQYGPLHYLIIVVDGRQPGYSEGCNMSTLQQLFLDRGVQTAFNLDGGGSTTLWFNGHVINQPASGDERKVSDIVMFTRK